MQLFFGVIIDTFTDSAYKMARQNLKEQNAALLANVIILIFLSAIFPQFV